MINIKRTKIINKNFINPIKTYIYNTLICYDLKRCSINDIKNNPFRVGYNEINKKSKVNKLVTAPLFDYSNLITKGIIKSFYSTSNVINNSNKKNSLSNENICFLRKLNNFRNNGVEYNVYNTDCVFQTIWSDFAYVSYVNNNKTFNNKLKESHLDFIKTDDESYTIFQDESAFIDYEETNKTEHFEHKTENENCSTLQKFIFSNLINKNSNEDYTLITRIPQEFNINLNTNRSVKIVNMGDSKLLADKEIKINFKHLDHNKNDEISDKAVNLEMRRVRSNNINIHADKGFKVKLTARSYLEGENLFIDIPNESVFRVKKIGVANKGKINLSNSDIDIRSVFSPTNKDYNESKPAKPEALSENLKEKIQAQKFLEFSCQNSNINIGSLHGNNFLNLNNCNLIIDNIDCENFILNSTNSKSLEIFINSLEKLEENDFFFLKLTENFNEKSGNDNNYMENFSENHDLAKHKKIFINEENKNDVLILNVNSSLLKLLKNIEKEDNEFDKDTDLQTKFFSFMHGESNFLSLLIENNTNFYDTDQINKNFLQFFRESISKHSSILEKLKEKSLFSHLKIVDSDIAENLMLINHYLFNVLLKDIRNSYRIIFIDAKDKESFELKEMTAWDITKKRIQNKISVANKRVNN